MTPPTSPRTIAGTQKLRVVAIDGPAGSGKSTVARLVAERLDFTHVDTGAMYRALTLKVLKSGVPVEDEDRVGRIVSTAEIELEHGRVFLDGEDVTVEIRSGKVTRHVSRVSSYPAVRTALLSQQRGFASAGNGPDDVGIVMEGRDIGTIVFPDARWKFFLDASPEVRARRRHAELSAAGKVVDFSHVLTDLRERDEKDSGRAVAPLRCPQDAVVIDSSSLSINQVVQAIITRVQKG